MKKTTVFRNMLNREGVIVMPGSYDPLSAKIVEMTGFEAVYMSGAGAAAAVLAAPDLGFMTMTEMVTQARNIVNAVDIPVIADADTGYGDALNVTRTAREYERAGVAGFHIEDLENHQCGLHMDKVLLPEDEMIGRIKAARDVLLDDDFILIARTDAIGAINGGVAEAIRRANLYLEAGANAIWVQEAPVDRQTNEIFEKVASSVQGSLMVAAGYNEHSITCFEQWGYKIVFYPTLSVQATMKNLVALMKDIKKHGTKDEFAANLPERGVSFQDFMEMTSFNTFQELRDRYVPKQRTNDKEETI